MGHVERLVGALEQLQVPMAYAREMLGLDGMDVETALNVRDKSRMKSVLRAAGVPCARHQLVTHPDEALAFAEAVGFPLVANRPPARERRRRTGWTICQRCAAGSRRFLRTFPRGARGCPGNGHGPRAARGVPGRGRAHLRQRDGRRRDRLLIDIRLPAHAARGAPPALDPVDRRLAPGAERPAV